MVPLKFGVAFPLVFHSLAGYRHLFWDATLKGIDNASADKSSKALFAVSFAASAALALTELA
jgi:succinate dehydrogenase (ubiquinone) cytochrome b560 subunit